MKAKSVLRLFVLAAQNFLILGFAVPLIQSLSSGRPIAEVITNWGAHIALWALGSLVLAGVSEWLLLHRRTSKSRCGAESTGGRGGRG